MIEQRAIVYIEIGRSMGMSGVFTHHWFDADVDSTLELLDGLRCENCGWDNVRTICSWQRHDRHKEDKLCEHKFARGGRRGKVSERELHLLLWEVTKVPRTRVKSSIESDQTACHNNSICPLQCPFVIIIRVLCKFTLFNYFVEKASWKHMNAQQYSTVLMNVAILHGLYMKCYIGPYIASPNTKWGAKLQSKPKSYQRKQVGGCKRKQNEIRCISLIGSNI